MDYNYGHSKTVQELVNPNKWQGYAFLDHLARNLVQARVVSSLFGGMIEPNLVKWVVLTGADVQRLFFPVELLA